MKFQCSCGAKYSLDIVPGMQPVTFVCQNCGQDYSAFINDLIQKETGQPAPSPVSAPPPSEPAAAVPPPAEGARLRISRAHEPAPQASPAPVSKYCERHRTELATDHCQVCHKPICPQCLEIFGHYCSAFCRNKVEGPLNAPVISGQKFRAEREFWRKTGLLSSVIGLVLFAGLVFWIWYAWIGSVPHRSFFVRFDNISHSGDSRIVGDQLVFLHGGTLARYDWQTKQKIWSIDLVSQQQVDNTIKEEDEEAASEHRDRDLTLPRLREKNTRIGLEEELTLTGAGKAIWIARGDVLTHYDWDTGQVLQQVPVTTGLEDITQHNGEFLAFGRAPDGSQAVTHINIDDGQTHTEEFSAAPAPAIAQNTAPRQIPSNGGEGLPLSSDSSDRPLNPRRVAQDAQNLSLPARLALPALLGNAEHNRQINDEINSEDNGNQPRRQDSTPAHFTNFKNFTLVPDGDTYIAFAVVLMQENLVKREAMKAPPAHSALDSPDISTANETAAVNEQLNELQRNRGGDTVTEDQSRYQVALRRPNSPMPDWIGNIVGPPQLFPLQTVNVIAGGKTLIVFDKSNKLLWKAQTTYDITGSGDQSFQSQYGAGPCVETNGTLYVFDQAVLSAYDATTGNVRWRIPSVGVVGLFFDDHGMLYVNTTTGNPDEIKYSRQIDVTKQILAVVMKVDPANGTILWTSKPGGYISYLSGKFIYASQYFDPGDQEDALSDNLVDLEKPPYLKIMRINPGNGHVMWEHDEDRAPVDIQFDHNLITVVLKKEVELLKFFTF